MAKKKKSKKSKKDIEKEILEEAKEEANSESKTKSKKGKKSKKKKKSKKSKKKKGKKSEKEEKAEKKGQTPSGKKKAEKGGKSKSIMEKAQGTLKGEPEEIGGGRRTPSETVMERVYTVPIRKNKVPSNRRTARAVQELKKFVKGHLDSDEIILTQELNQHIWEKGRKKPPKKIRVKIEKDDEGRAFVSLHK